MSTPEQTARVEAITVLEQLGLTTTAAADLYEAGVTYLEAHRFVNAAAAICTYETTDDSKGDLRKHVSNIARWIAGTINTHQVHSDSVSQARLQRIEEASDAGFTVGAAVELVDAGIDPAKAMRLARLAEGFIPPCHPSVAVPAAQRFHLAEHLALYVLGLRPER